MRSAIDDVLSTAAELRVARAEYACLAKEAAADALLAKLAALGKPDHTENGPIQSLQS